VAGGYNLIRMRLTSERVVVGTALVLALITLGLQAFVLRPRLWPAGPGVALSGGEAFARWAEPSPIAVIRPPDVRDLVVGEPVTAIRVVPGGEADRLGTRHGDRASEIRLNSCAFDLCPEVMLEPIGMPVDGKARTADELLSNWRAMQGMSGFVAFAGGQNVVLDHPVIWAMPDAPWGAWLRRHLGPLSQMTAFLAGALVLMLLGAHGTTAALMTLA